MGSTTKISLSFDEDVKIEMNVTQAGNITNVGVEALSESSAEFECKFKFDSADKNDKTIEIIKAGGKEGYSGTADEDVADAQEFGIEFIQSMAKKIVSGGRVSLKLENTKETIIDM